MRVLLIEDNPIDAMLLRERLAECGDPGIHLDHFESFERAAQALPCDVLLLDLSLPGSDGIETMRRARTLVGEVPIVILTSNDDSERALAMLREGAQDYLLKERYTADGLLRALRYAVERHALMQELGHADRLATVGRMAAGVAHEISNPATLVLGHTERLPELFDRLEALIRPEDRDARETLDECRRVAADSHGGLLRIQSVVRELQGYARVETHRTERCDLNSIVERTLNLASTFLRPRAEIQRSLSPVSIISGDPNRLEQVLTNLLMNAAHALENTPRGAARVEVATWEAEGRVHLSVRDNGCGMPEAIRERVFDPFFTTKGRERGTGLGLAVVSDIVREHSGTIQCESRAGEGTSFVLSLPRAAIQTPVPRPGESLAPVSGVRKRVLLVDDEKEILSMYADLLRDYHHVTIAHGGQEGIQRLDGPEHFDVVVCDLMMPDVDGIAVFERARDCRPELCSHFVFYSGGLLTERAQRFADEQPGEFLYKPVPLSELCAAIDRSSGLGSHLAVSAKR